MTKQITKPKPKSTAQPTDKDISAFVEQGPGKDTQQSAKAVSQEPVKPENKKSVKMSRITIDLSAEDHRAFKIACTVAGVKMNEEIRKLIVKRTAELTKAAQK